MSPSVDVEHLLQECQADEERSEDGSGDETLSLHRVDGARVYRMLRSGEVYERVAFSPAHVYRLMDENRFPRFERLGDRVVGLPEHVLDAFIAERMRARRDLPPLGFREPLPVWRFELSKVPVRCGLRLLRRHAVEAITGLAPSTYHPLILVGRFPAQVPVGKHAVRWVAHEIEAWVRDGPGSDRGVRSAGGRIEDGLPPSP